MNADEIKENPFIEHDRNAWSRCCHCGARNGLWGRPLEQHKPRCLYRGDANKTNVSTPNHNQLIIEDDKTFLPMMIALIENPNLYIKIDRVLKEIDRLDYQLLPWAYDVE